jgi:methylmalonyl-CoA/ethylmalonyl-CoA epimerase
MRFHHIGYAVSSIRRYLDDFLVPMFRPVRVTSPITDPGQRVTVCFVEMVGGTVIELVEPLGPGSPLDSIIGSKRGGVYHLCYEVDDLDAELKRFRSKRCLPLAKPVPAVAFEGRRIVFLLTPEHDLLELVEAKQAAAAGAADR